MEYVSIIEMDQIAVRRGPEQPYFVRRDGKWIDVSDIVQRRLLNGGAVQLDAKAGPNAWAESGQGGDPEKELP